MEASDGAQEGGGVKIWPDTPPTDNDSDSISASTADGAWKDLVIVEFCLCLVLSTQRCELEGQAGWAR